jgi:multiple sugar transport system ATP-binding protein
MTMGDHIAVMKDGILQQVGEPISIYNNPKNKFVASFIGSPPMNFMEGKIIRRNGKVYFEEGKIFLKLAEGISSKMLAFNGQEVILGIRSEDIYDRLFISDAPPENIVRATCEVSEPMGSEVYLYLNTGRHTFIARVGAHDRPQVNQDMDLVFNMSKVHFFNKDTQETIV